MLIKIGPYVLVGGTRATGMGVEWESFGGQRGVEVYFPVRSYARTRDSGNDVVNLSFSVSREFENYEDAEIFIADHLADVPREGLVKLISKRENGQEIVRYLLNARVSDIKLVEHMGVHTKHRYEVVGGLFTKTKPTS